MTLGAKDWPPFTGQHLTRFLDLPKLLDLLTNRRLILPPLTRLLSASVNIKISSSHFCLTRNNNNLAERALKMAILHRKNSLAYLTLRGARVGDVFMSLIHTCELNRVNPFDYLMALQKNADAVAQAPIEWFPWNYSKRLQAADTG